MTTAFAKSPSLQASLIDALGSGEPERALEQAFIQLSRGGDLPLLLAMIKALVRAGLAGIAVQLLHSAGGVLAAEPQLAALADQLSLLPSGEVTPEKISGSVQATLPHVLASRPHLQHAIGDFDSHLASFRVFRSIKGNVHVVGDSTGRRLEFVFPFIDQAAHAASMSIPPTTLTTSFLLIGVPSPALWRRIIASREAGGYVPPIDIVETDSAVFALWLGLIDDASDFDDERMAIFTGVNATLEYQQFLLDHPWRTPATHVLTNHRPRWNPPSLGREFSDRILAHREQHAQRTRIQMHLRYTGKDAVYWRNRFRSALNGGPPLRIVGFTTRYSTVIQHAMRDLACAFKRRGCEFDLAMQPSPCCANVDVVGALADYEYDLIVVINHLRSEFGEVMPANVPYVCWIQDHMDQLCDPATGKSVGELDLVLAHAPDVMTTLYGYRRDRLIATSNLTDPVTYDALPLPKEQLLQYRCDVSFASHGAETPGQLLEAITHGSTPQFRAMMKRFLQLITEWLTTRGPATPIDQLRLMLQAERESGHPPLSPQIRRGRVYPQAARLYDRVFRHQALEWVAEWATARERTFKLFGRGWERHPRFNRFACGEITPGHSMRCLYLASAINLQINGYSSLHQRLLDALAAGGFALSRYNPADFVHEPFAKVQQYIGEHHLQNLNDLLQLAETQPELKRTIQQATSLTGLVIAPLSDPARQEHRAILEAANNVEELYTDDGLFAVLKDMRMIPHRTAGDLPGFEQTTFASRDALHQLLDRYVDDPSARQATVAPMRNDVLAHDTYDTLTKRILNAFADVTSVQE